MSNVYIGSTPINFQYIGSSYAEVPLNFDFDQDTENFVTATTITNTSVKIAINRLVVSLKDNNLWDKMVQILPLVSDTTGRIATAFTINLKDTGSLNASFPGGGIQSSNLNGYSGSTYLETNLTPANYFTADDGHVSIYSNSQGEVGGTNDWGGQDAGSGVSYMSVGRDYSGGNSNKRVNFRASSLDVNVTNTDDPGMNVASLSSSFDPDATFYNNNVLIGTGSLSGTNAMNATAPLGGYKVFDPNERVTNSSSKQYQFLTVGYALNATEITNLTNAVQQFQEDIDTALGTSRAVTV